MTDVGKNVNSELEIFKLNFHQLYFEIRLLSLAKIIKKINL
jgi:hypothetical protein